MKTLAEIISLSIIPLMDFSKHSNLARSKAEVERGKEIQTVALYTYYTLSDYLANK